ncbi:hypothetical protein GKZ68_01510 [Hymenobacter sp. BRD128]|uniref:hypothetical protein n=1 Tax=Hymenobacter sp. BRD128 TaxID=2675878 RepID=UPI00156745F8|nr:hypothetical protein [Hymenobacter sp. BRD128]QKG55431.1 hypothetical protein GKZ68_01510 [Hymenobacter sp. BRD128]
MKLSTNARLLARPALLLALAALLATSGCATHGSLSQKTKWYRHHSGGKSVPCPCGH